jgi:hypothetical protein
MPGRKREPKFLAFCSLLLLIFPGPGIVYAIKGILFANNFIAGMRRL